MHRPALTEGNRRWWTLAAMCFALFMLMLDNTVVNVALPSIGVTMAPMSTAAMNAVSTAKAGVASGLLAMSRMVGGTFGVAALGALVQHIASDRLANVPLTAGQRDAIVHNLGAAGGLPGPAAPAARDAFVHAFSSGMWLCAGVALSGAVVAWALIDRTPAAVRYAGARTGREPLVQER